MASYDVFNPDVQQVAEPTFSGITREVTAPQANKGLAVAFEAAGKGIKDVGEMVKDSAKLDDYLHKEAGKNAAYAAADPLTNEHIESLEGKLSAIGVNPGGTSNVIPPTVGEPPAGLKNVAQIAEKFRTAKDLKADTDLEVSAKMMQVQKQLRSQFPGYRDYIDKEFSKATGVDPANYRVRALNEALASALSAANDPWKKALEVANRQENISMVPNISKHINDITNHVPGSIERLNDDVYLYAGADNRDKARLTALALKKGYQEDKSFETGKYIDQTVADKMATIISSEQNNHGTDTLQAALNVQNTLDKLPPEQRDAAVQHAATVVDSYINRIAGELKAQGLKPQPIYEDQPDGSKKIVGTRILSDDMGGYKAYSDRVDQGLDHLRSIKNFYTNKETGLAFTSANQARALNDATYAAIVGDPKYGPVWRILENLKRFGPQEVQDYFKSIVTKHMSEGMSTQLSNIATNVAIRTSDVPNPAIPAPVKEALGKIDENPNLSVPAKAKLAKSVLEDINSVVDDKNMPKVMKKNKLDNFFNQATAGTLAKIDVNNAHTIYAQFGNPALVRTAKEIGGATWDNYQGYMKNEFSQVLFKPDIVALHSLGQLDPRLKIGWDDKTHEWTLDFGIERRINNIKNYSVPQGLTDEKTRSVPIDALKLNSDIRSASATINRLNQGIGGYANVLKESGRDVNAELVRSMKEAGLGDVAFSGDTLLGHMGKALVTMAHSIGQGQEGGEDVVSVGRTVAKRIREHNRREMNQQFIPLGP